MCPSRHRRGYEQDEKTGGPLMRSAGFFVRSQHGYWRRTTVPYSHKRYRMVAVPVGNVAVVMFGSMYVT